jgi:Flp pilus assembly pilin Flp
MVQRAFKRFAADEDGAVTVDWVVLTAAVVAMVFAVFTIITQASVEVGANVVSDTLVDAADYTPSWGGTSTGGSGG